MGTRKPQADGLRRYGVWGGNPQGTIEDTTRCVESVSSGGFIPSQCSRKRGHGPDGLYCKQHDPEAVAAAKAKRHAEWEAQQARRREAWEKPQRERRLMIEALKAIADGYNDPRLLARETLKELGET